MIYRIDSNGDFSKRWYTFEYSFQHQQGFIWVDLFKQKSSLLSNYLEKNYFLNMQ